jgi:hypothetical protein
VPASLNESSLTTRTAQAQTINTDFRAPLSSLPSAQLPTTLPATHLTPYRTRLVQSSLSTRLLQGVLAALLLCAIVVFVLIDMRKVLPKKIGTIAAAASLLAGSRLLDEREGLIPPGAEWWSDKELLRRGIWQGQKFRMGWWESSGINKSGTERREFRIDVRP